MESIQEVLMGAKGLYVTLYLSSGARFEGTIKEMTYFTSGQRKTPRLITIVSGSIFYYIDAIKIDVLEISGGIPCNVKSAKKK